MGYSICGVIINSLPNFDNNEIVNLMESKTKWSKGYLDKYEHLSPKKLSITFWKDNTVILQDMLFYKNLSETDSLTNLELDISRIFPKSTFLIFVVSDSADFTGYSIIDSGIKIRTKAVVKGQIFLDYGDLLDIEIKLVEELIEIYKKKDGGYEKLESQFSDMELNEKNKLYLRLRDIYYEKNNIPNLNNQFDGSLDSNIIETKLSELFNCDYNDLEHLEYVQFDKKKLNLKKESFVDFIKIAEIVLNRR